METLTPPIRKVGEPAWEIAQLYPDQGAWSEEEYLSLTDSTNRLIEFTDGQIEVLPMPTPEHQRIILFLLDVLRDYVKPKHLGEVLFAGLRVRTHEKKFREPDVVFLAAKHADQGGDRYWEWADLVMEVVSPDDPQRDRVQKRGDYAEAGIPEYWIVDPIDRRVTVLKLVEGEYVVHGEHGPEERAASALLAGFEVQVGEIFKAGRGE